MSKEMKSINVRLKEDTISKVNFIKVEQGHESKTEALVFCIRLVYEITKLLAIKKEVRLSIDRDSKQITVLYE